MKQFVSLLLCLLLCAGCLAEAPAVFDPAWAG